MSRRKPDELPDDDYHAYLRRQKGGKRFPKRLRKYMRQCRLRQARVRASWDMETRAKRAGMTFGQMLEWSVPVVSTSYVDVPRIDEDEERFTTQTINRWRKSRAKTEHAARLALEMEVEERE